MWNQTELLKEIDDYFNQVTTEQFLIDLVNANSSELIEDIKC